MDLSASTQRRLEEVAFSVNAHLGEARRQNILTEGLRAAKAMAAKGKTERRILVVGGAGYIGSVVTAHLLDRGYQVRCFDSLVYGHAVTVFPFLGNPRYEFMYGDMSQPADVARALDGVTDVVLLAGLVGDPITKKYPEASARINDQGVANVVEACAGAGLNKLVFISTCSNYGLIPQGSVADETFELKPLSLYAKSKVAVESRLLSQAGQVDYHPTIMRFATAFGLSARMRFDLTVSEFTRAMHAKADLLVFDADTWRPYCHVQDFAEAIRRVLEAPVADVAFQVFNAGGDVNNYTKQMIVDAILEQLPGSPVRYQEHGADPRNYRVDFSKIRKTLDFEPTMTVKDGIRELIGALGQHLFDGVENNRNFYGNYEINI